MNDAPRSRWDSLKLLLLGLQVRLRFVVVLVVAFLVVGRWDALRGYWDSLQHRLSGRPAANQTVSADTEYFCPMDPGVVSDWAAICPVCNMDLVRRKRGEAVKLPDGVIARMQLSPYRIQLAGIRTTTVAPRALARRIRLAGRVVETVSLPPSVPATPGQSAEDEPPLSAEPLYSLALECEVDDEDLPFLTTGRQVEVRLPAIMGAVWSGTIRPARNHPPGPTGDRHSRPQFVRIGLAGDLTSVRPGLYGTGEALIPLEAPNEPAAATKAAGAASQQGPLAVPVTAVIDNGSQKLVYIESMPGMFDGVEVTLGPRCGDAFPVLNGLHPGQRVATVGAFLIDAEARLNPSLAAAYFGANREGGTAPRSPGAPAFDGPLSQRATLKTKAKYRLPPADQAIVDAQKICPVTDLPLGSMGRPIAVDIGGRKVFICCQGCETRLREESEALLRKLPAK